METFVGDTIGIVLKTGLNVSSYAILEIHFRRPDGSTGSWTADIHPTNNTWIVYDTLEYDLDQSGTWSVQAYVESAGGDKLHGKWVEFTVYDPIASPGPLPT